MSIHTSPPPTDACASVGREPLAFYPLKRLDGRGYSRTRGYSRIAKDEYIVHTRAKAGDKYA